MSTPLDISAFTKAKSDQLNADDLVGKDITVQITGVRVTGGEQPVTIMVSGGHMPVRPSKTMLRVLAAAWGTDANVWVGRWMRLYRDESVKWAGQSVGGIRVRALSHIAGPMTLALAESKGKKKAEKVGVLAERDLVQSGPPTANLDALLSDAGLTIEDVDRWLVADGKAKVADRNPEQRAQLAAALAAKPERLDAIRSLKPGTSAGDDGGAS